MLDVIKLCTDKLGKYPNYLGYPRTCAWLKQVYNERQILTRTINHDTVPLRVPQMAVFSMNLRFLQKQKNYVKVACQSQCFLKQLVIITTDKII